jgi:tetratricopeptide (TPR) repeat protein
MNRDQYYTWIANLDLLDETTLPVLQQVVIDYPFYHTARILFLLNLKKLNDYRFEHELRRTAAFAPDRARLRKLMQGGYSFAIPDVTAPQPRFEAPAEEKPERVIDERLRILEAQIRSRLQEIEEHQTRLKLLISEKEQLSGESQSEIVPAKVPADTEKTLRSLPKDELLEQFLKEQHKFAPDPAPFFNPEENARRSIEENEGIISETLARLVAAQGKYDRAIKIYEQLMLKNPQKSSYFAAQIEKLRKEL